MHVLTADGRLQAVTEAEHAVRRDGRQGQAASGGRQGHAVPQGREGADRSPAAGQQLRSRQQRVAPRRYREVHGRSGGAPALPQRADELSWPPTSTRASRSTSRPFPKARATTTTTLVQELYDDLHAKGLKLYIAVPVNDKDFDYAGIAQDLRRPDPDELRPALSRRRSRAGRRPGLVRQEPAGRAEGHSARRRSSAPSATTATTGR